MDKLRVTGQGASYGGLLSVIAAPLPSYIGARSHLVLPGAYRGLTRHDVLARSTRAAEPVTISALPEIVNMELYRGDDFAFMLTVTNADDTPADLTGETATAQIRVNPDAPDPPMGAFACSIAQNVITLVLTNIVSKALTATGVWDCQLTSASGSIRTLVRGSVAVTPDVTRP